MRALLRAHAPSGPALWLVLGRGLGFVATFAVPIVLVRVFDQTTFGTYKQLFLVYGTLYGLAQLGVAESLYYFVPRRPSEAGRYAANALATLAGAGAICAGALALMAPAIGGWLMNPALTATLPLLGVFLALMLTAQGALFLWMTDRIAGSMPARSKGRKKFGWAARRDARMASKFQLVSVAGAPE